MNDLPEPSFPLSEDQADICPACGKGLVYFVASHIEGDYEAVKCANECNLEDWWP